MRRIWWILCMGLAAPGWAQTAWLLGELHDQPEHQRQAELIVHELAAQGRLWALVLEMAERGRQTQGLPPEATEAQVRQALAWQDAAWPWAAYGPVVMAAVRAGATVYGGNLPRPRLREAMSQPEWEASVPAAAHRRLLAAVHDGHCGLVSQAQLPALVRMQIARDDALAATVAAAAHGAAPETVVLLLTGAVHASRATGVPLHLPRHAPALRLRTTAFVPEGAMPPEGFDEVRITPAGPFRDHCAELRARGMPAITPPASR
ncbi:ChaN family lipoprotein [Caldimonas sp.]|uniref:ChaN family lipoprotein n=1 Tax=Caldimonas sp. TaxID=2838790 RepID=UPI00307FA879